MSEETADYNNEDATEPRPYVHYRKPIEIEHEALSEKLLKTVEDAQQFDIFRKHMYVLVREAISSRILLDNMLGTDLLAVIWQLNQKALNEKNRRRFEYAALRILDGIKEGKLTCSIFFEDGKITKDDLNELYSSIRHFNDEYGRTGNTVLVKAEDFKEALEALPEGETKEKLKKYING